MVISNQFLVNAGSFFLFCYHIHPAPPKNAATSPKPHASFTRKAPSALVSLDGSAADTSVWLVATVGVDAGASSGATTIGVPAGGRGFAAAFEASTGATPATEGSEAVGAGVVVGFATMGAGGINADGTCGGGVAATKPFGLAK